MLRMALLCLLVLPSVAGAATLDRDELRVGLATDDPPFAYVSDTGEVSGFSADMARTLCARMRVRCVLGTFDPQEIVAQVLAGAVDLAPGLTITEARRRDVAFTDAYYQAASRFIARRGKSLDLSATGLRGLIVGVERGSMQDRYVSATFPAATVRRYGDRSELYLDLALDRLDTVLTDIVAARVQFLGTDLGAEFDFVGATLNDPQWFGDGVGIAVSKGDDHLRHALNEALRGLRSDGTLDVIASRYFPFQLDGS